MPHTNPQSYLPVIVAGSRDFADFALMSKYLDMLRSGDRELIIISGTAEGADTLGENYAEQHCLHCAKVPALWRHPSRGYRRSAGPERNAAMAALGQMLIAFPTSASSRGTRAMVDIAARIKMPTRIITPSGSYRTWEEVEW